MIDHNGYTSEFRDQDGRHFQQPCSHFINHSKLFNRVSAIIISVMIGTGFITGLAYQVSSQARTAVGMLRTEVRVMDRDMEHLNEKLDNIAETLNRIADKLD